MPLRDEILKRLPKKSPNDLLIDAALSGIEALGIPTEYALGAASGAPGERRTGEQALQAWGALPAEHPPATGQGFEYLASSAKPYIAGLMGMGVETVADPLNLVPGVAAGKATAKAARVKALNEASRKMRAAGAMPQEIVEKLHPSMLGPDGKPKRWYHGTGQPFDKFDMEKADPNALYGSGIYTTENPQLATEYAVGDSPQPAWRIDPEARKRIGTLMREAHIGYDKPLSFHGNLPSLDEATREAEAVLRNHMESGLPQEKWMGLGRQARFLENLPQDAKSLMREDWSPYEGANVRMHYLDVRKPLNVEQPYMPEPFGMKGDVWGVKNVDDTIRELQEHIDYRRTDSLPSAASRGDSKMVGFFNDDISSHEQKILGFKRLRDEYMNAAPKPHTGEWYLKQFSDSAEEYPSFARQHGFDAIQHTGGAITGGIPHNVTIALDPSQVYSPYIAPALQEIPNIDPATLKKLAAYHAAKQGGR